MKVAFLQPELWADKRKPLDQMPQMISFPVSYYLFGR